MFHTWIKHFGFSFTPGLLSSPQAQAFYERELEAMKRTQQLTADNLLAWKRTEAELRREFQTQEAALQKTLGKLRAELARVTDEARENREKSLKLQASLTTSESSIKVSLGQSVLNLIGCLTVCMDSP